MSKKREDIDIDVYTDEQGFQFYRVIKHSSSDEPADAINGGGWFVYEDGLNEWLEENDSRVRVVRDYRKSD